MPLDGVDGNDQCLSNLLVGSAGRHQLEYFTFPVAQGFDPEDVRVYVNGIDCPLNIASTVGFIRIPEPVNDVLAHT